MPSRIALATLATAGRDVSSGVEMAKPSRTSDCHPHALCLIAAVAISHRLPRLRIV